MTSDNIVKSVAVGEIKNLRALSKAEDGFPKLRILLIVEDFLRSINVVRNMQNDTGGAKQVDDLVDMLYETYPHYTPEDFALYFYRLKSGQYVKILDRMDAQIILTGLRIYDSERDAAIEQYNSSLVNGRGEVDYSNSPTPQRISEITAPLLKKLEKVNPFTQGNKEKEEAGLAHIAGPSPEEIKKAYNKYLRDRDKWVEGVNPEAIGEELFDLKRAYEKTYPFDLKIYL